MSIEEIIKVIEELADGAEECAHDYDYVVGVRNTHAKKAEALRAAISLLGTHPDAQPNEPLTLEDALQMHGDPAYLCFPDGGEWVLIRVVSPDKRKVELVHRNGILAPIHFVFDGGGKLYRRPPKEV